MTDAVARRGGEEFVAILPVPLDGAVTFCERVRQLTGALTFRDVGRVTVSAGVAERRANETLDSVLERADARLYAAKSHGRNRVEAA